MSRPENIRRIISLSIASESNSFEMSTFPL